MVKGKAPAGLPVVAEAEFDEPIEPHQLITFLNRSLKREGWVFGLSRHASKIRLRLYRAEPWTPRSGPAGHSSP